jgi:two-component system sensor histidine kinase MprB
VSLRTRLTLGVAAAVAIAVVAASVVVYFVVRGQLRNEIDNALEARAQELPPVKPVQLATGEYFLIIKGPQFGAAAGLVQVATVNGQVYLPSGASAQLPVTAAVKRVAAGRQQEHFSEAEVKGVRLRVLAVQTNVPGYAIMLARPLSETNAALGRITRYLFGIGAAGIAIAAMLGLLVTRAVLRPVRRLTEATEYVTETRDLSGRIDVDGGDELARLAASFNTMLAALEDSLRAQRQFVADASHELRTPLTSLRTNIEVLARSESMPAAEREKLLADVVEQLSEMSTLVAELVHLARGDVPTGEPETLRLDELVLESVERARRNAPNVRFATELYESTVEAVPSALERAVGNLLDNAAKWSPPGGTVEVAVTDHEVQVRDHGPGIDEADVPFVFDRFYRAPAARGMPGSGLGLAIVHQVAEAHGGEVLVERPPDGGTRMRLKLPA